MAIRSAIDEAVVTMFRDSIEEALKELRISHLPIALTPEQAAEQVGISLSKMREWTRREDFPAIRDGRRIIIPTSAFIDWLENCAKNQ